MSKLIYDAPAPPSDEEVPYYYPFHQSFLRARRRRWGQGGGAAPTYDSTVLGMSGLVGYWKLDEVSGTVAADSFGANPGSYIATPTLHVAGPVAASFGVLLNGTTQYVSVPDANTLDLGDSLSMAMWIKRSHISQSSSEIFASKGTNAWHWAVNAVIDSIAIVRTGVLVLSSSAISTVNDITLWHHIAFVKVGADVRLYYDGVDISGIVTNSTLTDNATNLEIGRKADSATGYFGGSMSRAALFNRALTAPEITTLYAFHL